MLRPVAVFCVMAALSIAGARPALAAKAAEIVAWCSADSPERSEPLCRSYLEAIAEAAARPDRLEDNLGSACFPAEMPLTEPDTIDRIADLVLTELKGAPDLDGKSGFDAIAPILIRKYPCP